jgi:hypothetical protein
LPMWLVEIEHMLGLHKNQFHFERKACEAKTILPSME